MQQIEINLLRLEQQKSSNQFTKTVRISGVVPTLAKLSVCAIAILSASAVFSFQQSAKPDSALNTTFNSIITGAIPHFGTTADRALAGESDDRINILLLGIGGENHNGGQLSDTNIVASIKPSTRQIALISIPRDLVVPIEGVGWRKINEVNAFGEQEQPGTGPAKAVSVVEKILNISIPYYVRVDFQAFSDIVDTLGGITVNVERSFTDYTYPTRDYKYQTVSFTSGSTVMDGDRALKFVRSRHSGMNNEGSDFARSKRQQKVLAAIKDKIFSTDFLLNPKKISPLLSSLNQNVATNISPWQGIKLLTIARETSEQSIVRLTFDDSPDNYLVPDWPAGGAYTLKPKDGMFEGMQQAVAGIFEAPAIVSEKESITSESLTILIRNGTSITGLATRYANLLSEKGFRVIGYSNAQSRDQAQTTLYQTGSSEKTKSLTALETLLGTEARTTGWNPKDLGTSSPNFLIVLGSDAATRQEGTK